MTSQTTEINVLLVDDDATFRRALAGALTRRRHRVEVASSATEALRLAQRRSFDVALLDLKMPGIDGIQLMEELKRPNPGLQVVILTGHGTIPSAIDAIQRGAFQYLTKPCDVDDVEGVLQSAQRQAELLCENARLREVVRRSTPYAGIIGDSAPILEVFEIIERTKDSWSPVLIQGESGTGKELVARALHTSSLRRERPFIAINCASLKPDLLENELFGHTEGAFTGASKSKAGLFEVADQGTIFIDEIADMDLRIQASLLRAVESGVFRPLGSTREVKVQVRLIAAANKDLHEEVEAGRFRRDLLYRLDVVHLELPPLRSRPSDIPLLVEHYFQGSREAREKKSCLDAEALEVLKNYDFPGNVRELFHVLERAILLSAGGVIASSELDIVLHPGRQPLRKSPAAAEPVTLVESETRYIRQLLEREEGNVSRVSHILGIDRRTLQRKMKRYGLR